jgi:hypothetical protein
MQEGPTMPVATSRPPPLPGASAPTSALPEADASVAALLKTPEAVAVSIARSRDLAMTGLRFLVVALVCHAVFGLAAGLYGGWSVGGMAAAKAPLIGLCSLLLCFPSLYVFGCVGGSGLTIGQWFAVGTACLAMIGLLLVGLAPVAWLFAVSTANLPFVVFLVFFVWLIAVGFAIRLVARLRGGGVYRRVAGINLWFLVFFLVTLQMTTVMRPILTAPSAGWWTSEKQFFLGHFGDCFRHKR